VNVRQELKSRLLWNLSIGSWNFGKNERKFCKTTVCFITLLYVWQIKNGK